MSTWTDKPKSPTVMDPLAVTLGKVYAEALLDSLPDPSKAAVFGDELKELSRLLHETSGCMEFLTNPAIGASQRLKMVQRIFGPFVSEPVSSFLGVLANNHRLAALPAIAEQFEVLRNRRAGNMDVQVRTATTLSEKQIEMLTKTLTEKFNATPRLSITLDPNLIGGLCVQVGDTIYDASIAGNLRIFRDKVNPKK